MLPERVVPGMPLKALEEPHTSTRIHALELFSWEAQTQLQSHSKANTSEVTNTINNSRQKTGILSNPVPEIRQSIH